MSLTHSGDRREQTPKVITACDRAKFSIFQTMTKASKGTLGCIVFVISPTSLVVESLARVLLNASRIMLPQLLDRGSVAIGSLFDPSGDWQGGHVCGISTILVPKAE